MALAIYDLLGEQILPGHLIAFPLGARSFLSVGIVIDIEEGKINYLTKSKKVKYDNSKPKAQAAWTHRSVPFKSSQPKRRKRVLSSTPTARRSYITINPNSTSTDRVIVIKDPFVLISNPIISEQLEIIEMAKDLKILPQNYVFGRPI